MMKAVTSEAEPIPLPELYVEKMPHPEGGFAVYVRGPRTGTCARELIDKVQDAVRDNPHLNPDEVIAVTLKHLNEDGRIVYFVPTPGHPPRWALKMKVGDVTERVTDSRNAVARRATIIARAWNARREVIPDAEDASREVNAAFREFVIERLGRMEATLIDCFPEAERLLDGVPPSKTPSSDRDLDFHLDNLDTFPLLDDEDGDDLIRSATIHMKRLVVDGRFSPKEDGERTISGLEKLLADGSALFTRDEMLLLYSLARSYSYPDSALILRRTAAVIRQRMRDRGAWNAGRAAWVREHGTPTERATG